MTLWEQGLQAFRQGRLHEAGDKLRAATLDAECTVSLLVRFRTLSYLGAARYALGRHADAVTAFEEAVRFSPFFPPPPDLLVNLANALLAMGRSDDARETLRRALQDAPGHLEAQMLLQRLERSRSSADGPPVGVMLGEDPSSVRRYLETLSFSRTADGLDPDQVRLAIAHASHYLDRLVEQVLARDEIIARQETEIAFARQQLLALSNEPQEDSEQLTPLEVLFQKKP